MRLETYELTLIKALIAKPEWSKKMQNLIPLASLFLLIGWGNLAYGSSTCQDYNYDSSYLKELPTESEPELISRNTPLFEGGKITCNVSRDHRNTSRNILNRIETGTYKNIKYRIFYSDGSGSIQGDKSSTLDYIKDLRIVNWSSGCRVDGMNDKLTCYINKKNLTIGISQTGSNYVIVGSSHYPSSDIAVRIDQSSPIIANEKNGFTTQQSNSIISSLKAGEKILTRYQEWPYQINKDLVIETYGFNEAWEIINTIYHLPK